MTNTFEARGVILANDATFITTHIGHIMEMTWKHSRLKPIPPVSTVAKVFVG
jgi:hypothetical protein